MLPPEVLVRLDDRDDGREVEVLQRDKQLRRLSQLTLDDVPIYSYGPNIVVAYIYLWPKYSCGLYIVMAYIGFRSSRWTVYLYILMA